MKRPYINEPGVVRYSTLELKDVKSKTDFKALDALSDHDIDYSDLNEQNEQFWARAQVVDYGPKKVISIRIEPDVLDWFKAQKGRYQKLMNEVLKNYMHMHCEPQARKLLPIKS